jgi:hypothetical protein
MDAVIQKGDEAHDTKILRVVASTRSRHMAIMMSILELAQSYVRRFLSRPGVY